MAALLALILALTSPATPAYDIAGETARSLQTATVAASAYDRGFSHGVEYQEWFSANTVTAY